LTLHQRKRKRNQLPKKDANSSNKNEKKKSTNNEKSSKNSNNNNGSSNSKKNSKSTKSKIKEKANETAKISKSLINNNPIVNNPSLIGRNIFAVSAGNKNPGINALKCDSSDDENNIIIQENDNENLNLNNMNGNCNPDDEFDE